MDAGGLLPWIVLLPFFGAAANLLAGRFLPRAVVNLIACGTVAIASLFSFVVLKSVLGETTRVAGALFPWDWISVPGEQGFTITFGLLADRLATVMLVVVTFVGFWIHLYSTGYMAGEKRYSRYFGYLNLFTGFMLLLVLADSLLLLFVGWEGVGLCSYLLIGFWFDDREKGEENSRAGMKAFIVNRIGDWGFTVGMLLLFVTIGTTFGVWTLDIEKIREIVLEHRPEFQGALGGVTFLVCVLLFVGATGKSAQIPLYVWLPDAMAGPTPVSALIHAATMVTAGVYMVCRMGFLFSQSAGAMTVVAVIGAATALFAAVIAFAQNDIKKVLAYSTVSQLGFMFLAAGVGAFPVAIFHVATHAAFKACLFLGSGSVILGCHHEQDMRKMGGLKKYMPITYGTFLVATLALAGFPLTAGFFSKDEILLSAFTTHAIPAGLGKVLWFTATLAAAGTAFYMARAVIMTFWGEYRGGAGHGEHGGLPRESPWNMYVPLIVLAVLSVLAGFLWTPWWNLLGDFLEPTFDYLEPHEFHAVPGYPLMIVATLVALAGLWLGYDLLFRNPAAGERWKARLGGLPGWAAAKFYVDELYFATVVRFQLFLNDLCARFDNRVVDGAVNLTGSGTAAGGHGIGVFDNEVVDAAVNGVADATLAAGRRLRRLQSGDVRFYIMMALVGALLLIAVFSVVLVYPRFRDLFPG